MKYLVLLGALISGLAVAKTPPTQGNIEITVTGLPNLEGTLRCTLFSEEKKDSFPTKEEDKWSSVQGQPVKVKEEKQATCTFENVPHGVYAIAGYFDENKNDEFDMMFFIPQEPYFASQDAKGSFGPPQFKDAKFEHKGKVTKLSAKAQ